MIGKRGEILLLRAYSSTYIYTLPRILRDESGYTEYYYYGDYTGLDSIELRVGYWSYID